MRKSHDNDTYVICLHIDQSQLSLSYDYVIDTIELSAQTYNPLRIRLRRVDWCINGCIYVPGCWVNDRYVRDIYSKNIWAHKSTTNASTMYTYNITYL